MGSDTVPLLELFHMSVKVFQLFTPIHSIAEFSIHCFLRIPSPGMASSGADPGFRQTGAKNLDIHFQNFFTNRQENYFYSVCNRDLYDCIDAVTVVRDYHCKDSANSSVETNHGILFKL